MPSDAAPGGAGYDIVGKRVWVAGHRGMVGAALVRRLRSEACQIVTAGRSDVDLLRQDQTENWLSRNKPDVVIVAAAKVGGILANDTYPADFLYQNLMIEANIVEGLAPGGRRQAALPRFELHLSQTRAAADPGGLAPDRPAGADQRMVCDRQDRRHQARPVLSQAIWLRLHFGHADQSLRTGGQFRPPVEPRHAGAAAQGA